MLIFFRYQQSYREESSPKAADESLTNTKVWTSDIHYSLEQGCLSYWFPLEIHYINSRESVVIQHYRNFISLDLDFLLILQRSTYTNLDSKFQ